MSARRRVLFRRHHYAWSTLGPGTNRSGSALAAVVLALSLAAIGLAEAAVGSFRAGAPVAASPSASWVTDGGVNAIAVAGDTVYAGGSIGYVGARTGALALFGTGDQRPQRGWPAILGGGGDPLAAPVEAVVSDASGGWIVGGSFATVGGYPCPSLARITRDRRLDRRFCLGPNGVVHALAVHNKTVFVGGDFLRIGGAPRVRLAAVDLATGKLLAWRAPVTGRPTWDHDDKILPSVEALAVAGGTLVVGGFFERVGGALRANLAAVDAVTARPLPWRPTGNARYAEWAFVRSLATSGDTAYVFGEFDKLGGQSADGVGAVDVRTGSRLRWQPRIRGTPVGCLAVAGDRVYLTKSVDDYSGAVIVAVTRDTGSLVKTFSVPRISGGVDKPSVNALAVAQRTLYLGGDFTRIGKRGVSNLAAVDLRSGRVLPGVPLANSEVHALAVANGTLAVGGTLTSAGGTSREGLVAIDGSTGKLLPWAPRLEPPPASEEGVTALAIAGPRLYAGGGFTKIDGVGRPGLAAFDLNTRRLTSWAPKLTPRDQYSLVQAMAADGNTIYIGGVFARANGEPRRHLAAFDATTGALLPWNPQRIGGAVKELGDIKAIDVADGRVYVAYEFTNTNGHDGDGLAEIDAATGSVSAWSPRFDGIDGVTALECTNGVLYLGGDFSSFAGQRRLGLAAVDATTHQLLPWKPSLGPRLGIRRPVGKPSSSPSASYSRLRATFDTAGGASHPGIALDRQRQRRRPPVAPTRRGRPPRKGPPLSRQARRSSLSAAGSISAYRLTPTQP